MFLTKKNTSGLKQQPKTKNSKALGGWDDNEQQKQGNNLSVNSNSQNTTKAGLNAIIEKQINTSNKNSDKLNLLDYENNSYVSPVSNDLLKQFSSKQQKRQQIKLVNNKNEGYCLYNSKQLSEMPNITCQCKAVQSVLMPGCIRVKQNQTVLNQFYNQAKDLDVSIVGSILISYLFNQNADFQVKAKSLYAIQYLNKKNIQYSVFFKLNIQSIKDCPITQQNSDSYLKIKKNLLVNLGALTVKPEQLQKQYQDQYKIDFVDPGYNKPLENLGVAIRKNSEKQQKPKMGGRKFISPNQAKFKDKKLNQNTIQRKAVDLLGQQVTQNDNLIDLSYGAKSSNQTENKHKDGQFSKQIPVLTYDDLVATQNSKYQNKFNFNI